MPDESEDLRLEIVSLREQLVAALGAMGPRWVEVTDAAGNKVCINLAVCMGIGRGARADLASVIMLGPGVELPLRSPGYETLRRHVAAASRLIELPDRS